MATERQIIENKVITRFFALIEKCKDVHYTSMAYICILTTFFAPTTTAATLSLDFGHSDRILARQAVNSYTMEPAPKVAFRGIGLATDGMWYGEVYTGAWDGHRTGRIVALSAGYQSLTPHFIRLGIGPARISDTNYTLTEHNQILTTIMIGYRGDGYEIRLGYRHISNGSGIMHGESSPNLGEDFLVGGIGVKF